MEMLESKAPEGVSENAPMAAAPRVSVLQLTADEGARLLRIISRAALIRRHQDIHLWLAGELQQFLPHQVLISAWGDFARWNLSFDLTSGIAGVRTSELARCPIDDFVRECYRQWLAGGRQPLVLKTADIGWPHARCACTLHAALRQMRSLLVHGVRDRRACEESVYVALSSGSFAAEPGEERWLSLIDALIAQIDAAFRKVAPFSLEDGCALSRREKEILAGLACGKTNVDIAAALEISPYTVKNHVQRIFRKIGVHNRTQAATQYRHAVRGQNMTRGGDGGDRVHCDT